MSERPSDDRVEAEAAARDLGETSRAELFRVDPEACEALPPPPPPVHPDPPAPLPERSTRRVETSVGAEQLERLLTAGEQEDAKLMRAQAGLIGELAELVGQLEVAATRENEAGTPAATGPAGPGPISRSLRRRLAVLRHAVGAEEKLAPTLDATAALGHAYPGVDEVLGVAPGDGLAVLEDLADMRLLDRELVNRVHVCPKCRRCQLNFRELCARCDDLDIALEPLILHFRCGATALERDFREGLDLVCPKCRKTLLQLGQDFERPHETYACGRCKALFEEPRLEGQCLSCQHVFPSHEAPTEALHAFTPTPLALRALELGRLTALDVDTLLVDASLRVATRDFMRWEMQRELERLTRYKTPFSFAILTLECDGRTVPFLREWSATAMRVLCEQLAKTLRNLDMVARLDGSRLGMLLPEADEAGLVAVKRRLMGLLDELELVDAVGTRLVPGLEGWAWSEPGVQLEDVLKRLGSAG